MDTVRSTKRLSPGPESWVQEEPRSSRPITFSPSLPLDRRSPSWGSPETSTLSTEAIASWKGSELEKNSVCVGDPALGPSIPGAHGSKRTVRVSGSPHTGPLLQTHRIPPLLAREPFTASCGHTHSLSIHGTSTGPSAVCTEHWTGLHTAAGCGGHQRPAYSRPMPSRAPRTSGTKPSIAGNRSSNEHTDQGLAPKQFQPCCLLTVD